MESKEIPREPCVSRCSNQRREDAFILVYVGDLLIYGMSAARREAILHGLKSFYELRMTTGVNPSSGVQLQWPLRTEDRPLSMEVGRSMYTESTFYLFEFHRSNPACTLMFESFSPGWTADQAKSVFVCLLQSRNGHVHRNDLGRSCLYLS